MFHTNHVHQHAWRSTQHACPGGKVAWSGQAVASRPRIAACSATSAPPTASADDTSDSEPRKIRRTRLFRSESSEPKQPASAAVAQPAETERSKRSAPEPPAVSDEFRKAFESLGIQTLPVRQAPTRQARRESFADVDRQDGESSSSARDPSRRSRSSREGSDDRESKLDRFREWGRGPGDLTSSSSSRSRHEGPSWSGRGKQAGRDDAPAGVRSSVDGRRLSPEERRRQWEEDAAERQRLLDEAERKRLIRKERSERIPSKPKGKQNKVVFQAITREWDEKVSVIERRGARAAARNISSLGLYDRNKTVRKLRQKYVQGKIDESQDPEARKVAQRAVEQVQEAAALSIQPPKELIYQAAAGVKRSFERAAALPEGEWERLKEAYKSADSLIKIGRRGCTPSLVAAIQSAWRGREVVKLRIHDDKSSRKMNLPRLNVLLRELEEQTGGVLTDSSGSSIWLYRGPDWKPLPVAPPYKPPAAAEHFTENHKPLGKWTDIAGISCYIVSSSDTSDMAAAAVSSNRGIGEEASLAGAVVTGGDVMTLVFLPDQFPMKGQPMMMQIADHVAAKGVQVVMPDLLGPPAHFKTSSLSTNGQGDRGSGAGYWLVNQWPVVRKRKLEHMDWFQSGPGSWLQQRPRLLQIIEEMQKQNMYDADAPDLGAPLAAAAATAAAAGAADSTSDQQQHQDSDPDRDSTPSSSSGSGGKRPLGILGFSWGSHAGLRAAGDDAFVSAGLKAVAAISPMTFQKDVEIATAFKVPVCLLAAKYDPMEQMMLTVDLLQRVYAPRCIFKRFGKVRPGWANWLPQWTDARAMYQAAEQLILSVAFMQRELLGNTASAALLPPPLPSTTRTAAEQEEATAKATQADAQTDSAAEEEEEEEEAAESV